MRRISVSILLIVCVFFSACSYNSIKTHTESLSIDLEKTSNSIHGIKVGGVSGNMINNGLADGDSDVIVYSWENQLIEVNTDGTNRRILADDWSSHICIVDDWVYYRKIGDTSDSVNGIYKIKKDGSEKTQITSDTTQSIYVVGDWLYYNNWSYTTDICRIKTDGTDKETLYSGQYDCLSTDGNNLFFDDFGKNIYIKAPMDGGEFKVIIPSAWGCMPQVSGGWIYYMDGTDYKSYRIKTDGTGKEPYVTVDSSINHFLATDNFNFYGLMKIDNYTGAESEFFTENDADRWIAGNNIVYLEKIYDPNNPGRYKSPISQTLFVKNISNGDPIILEHKEN